MAQAQNQLNEGQTTAVVERVASSPHLQAGLWDQGWPIFPAEILECADVGEPARRCWAYLWRWAGCKPGHVKCDAGNLMSALGAADKRTVRGYRNELAKLGALNVIDDGRRWVLYVNDPRELVADRPKVVSRGPYRYFTFMEYRPDDEPADADQSGSFCAKTPAGESAQKLPADDDAELISFQKILRQRQAEAQQQVAREAPPPAGDLLRSAAASLARQTQERSYVPCLSKIDVPPERSCLARAETLEDAPAASGNVELHEGGNVGSELAADRGARFRSELTRVVGKLGRPNQLLMAISFVLSHLDGPLSEASYEGILESASAAPIGNRWKIVCGGIKKQLSEMSADLVKQRGFWGVDAAHDAPTCQLRIRDAKRRLAKLGIAWQPEWAGTKFPKPK